MLRLLLGAVVAANAIFFAWTQGWFAPAWPGPHAGEREPERLTAQVRPERVVLLPAPAASAAISAARAAAFACLEAGPLSEAEATAAEAALLAASVPAGSWQRAVQPPPPLWLVFAGRVKDAAALNARADEQKSAFLGVIQTIGNRNTRFRRHQHPAADRPDLFLPWFVAEEYSIHYAAAARGGQKSAAETD